MDEAIADILQMNKVLDVSFTNGIELYLVNGYKLKVNGGNLDTTYIKLYLKDELLYDKTIEC